MGCKRNTLYRVSAILLLAVLAGLASPRDARAVAESTPRTMNFDGYLTDTGGSPLSGVKDMKFGLIVDTTRVWYAEYASVSVISGVFAVVLGDVAQGGISLDPSTGAPQAGTLLPISPSVLSTITSASVVTLEVEVYNGALFETLSPAYPVSAALFAIKADTVDGYDSTQLAKLDGSGNILSNNGTIVINNAGSWVGPSANIGSGGLTVTAGGAAITGNSNITGTLGVTSSLTAGSITTSGAMNASGKISATAAPTGTGVSNGSFYVNPASATLNNTLFGVAVNGTQKFRVDAEGDATVGGDLTVTGTISGTVANAGNATTVNGIGASTATTANMLFPLDLNAKFPNSVLYTGSGNSLDADTVDGLHAAAFGQLSASNTWSGATNAFSGITASTISASGGLTVSAGSISVPAGSIAGAAIANQGITATQIANTTITATQIANSTITDVQLANNAVTATKQFSIATATSTNATVVADCGAGNVAIGGSGTCFNSGGTARTLQESCPCTASGCTTCSNGSALTQYWFLRCSGAGSNTAHRVYAFCVAN